MHPIGCKMWGVLVDSKYEKEVGLRIRYYREQKKMTQDQLSTKLQLRGCDITRSALAKMEVGQRHIYLDEIKLIVELLGVEYTDLL